MPFCLNPECPHKKKTGKPAEFLEGFTCCSDCESPLSEKPPETGKIIRGKNTLKRPITDLHRRILYTLGLILIWRALAYLPVPGINSEMIGDFIVNKGGLPAILPRISVFALGLMPFISAYVLIEIFSLFVPLLKSWRSEGSTGRAKLSDTSRFTAVFLALLQGYGIAQGIESMSQGEFVINPGISFRLITALTLTAGMFITIMIADLITRRGIGHGISIILFAGYIGGSSWSFIQFREALSRISEASYADSPLKYLALFLLATAITITFIVLIEKSHGKIPVKFEDGTEASVPLKLTTAGIVPASWATSLIMIPATLSGFVDNAVIQKISFQLTPGSAGFFIALPVCIIFFYYLFTAFFYNPKNMIDFLKKKKASIIVPCREEERYIDRSLEAMAFVGALYLCSFILFKEVIDRLWLMETGLVVTPFLMGSVPLITATAIALDLSGELNIRRKHLHLVKVYESHDVPLAGLLKSLLKEKGIQCHLRGYYHRALLYFFGPYIEISVFVQKEMAEEAKEVINCYLE